MAQVFLSYDHDDAALARPLVAALEKAGHGVWFDRQIHGGAQFSKKIEQALDEADAVLVLWSAKSIDSAWVRDEAAEGRDRGKLVTLSIDGVSPPMGFRQYQTIDLGNWQGRGRVPKLAQILDAIAGQVSATPDAAEPPSRPMHRAERSTGSTGSRPRWLLPALAGALILCVVGFGAWKWLGGSSLPLVKVAAADPSPRSAAAANDLFVKLGSLAQVGNGKWQLLDLASNDEKPDLLFRTADTGTADHPQASLVLLDGKSTSLLWSREFDFPAGGQADMRQQLSLTAGRVLGCALETRAAGGLRSDLQKLFYDACASLAEASYNDADTNITRLRKIVGAAPKFVPAWKRLIYSGTIAFDSSRGDQEAFPRARSALRADLDAARAQSIDVPEMKLAALRFLPPSDFQKTLDITDQAVAQDPQEFISYSERSSALARVGRMSDSVVAARHAAELDPLSPAPERDLILSLAYAGLIDASREELAKAEKLWPGTGALNDAKWAFNLRFGDPKVALQTAQDEGLKTYLIARADPSPANVAKMKAFIQNFYLKIDAPYLAGAVQALGDFNDIEAIFQWLDHSKTADVAEDSPILFRPALAGVRKDARFMAVANRIGLVSYWRSSGKWPDFCDQPGIPYNCQSEAAKYAH